MNIIILGVRIIEDSDNRGSDNRGCTVYCYETHKISNLPLDVKGYMLPPEPKLYHSPIVSQILLNYIKIEDTTQTKRGQGWLGLK